MLYQIKCVCVCVCVRSGAPRKHPLEGAHDMPINSDCRDFVPAYILVGSVGKSAILFYIDFRNCG